MSYTPTEWESTDVVTATRMNALETAVGDMNMSYTPNTWSDGDILSAEKMNALEQAVASGGGGGSSDFSTATVTVSVGNYQLTIGCLAVYEAGEYASGAPAMLSTPSPIVDATVSLSIPLYKGTVLVTLYTSGEISTSGNIQVLGSQALITGDCTITIS